MKKWKTPLAVFMAVVCCLWSVSPSVVQAAEASTNTVVEEATQQTVNYVALGDSITAGSTSYVNAVSQHLSQKYGNCNTSNLAVSGWTSQDLLDALTNPSNAMYSRMNNALANADYITIDIGSNDLFIGTGNIVADCFGCTADQLGAVTAEWSQKLVNARGFQAMILYLQAMTIAKSIRARLLIGNEIPSVIRQFESDYMSVMAAIKAVAPNAKVYVGNLYNPYNDAAPIYVGSYMVLDLESYSATNVQKMNTIIANRSTGCTVVDLYNTINSPSYIYGDVVNYDYDPHPNQAGQAAIANKFIAAMK